MLIFFVIIASSISVSMATLGYSAFVKNKESLTNRLFFIFSIVLAIWCASNFLENWFIEPWLATIFLKLDFILGPFVFFLIFLFLLNFPEPNKKLSKYATWLIIPTIFISSITLTDGIITNINFNNGKIGFDFGPWFNVYAILILTYFITAIIHQIWQFSSISGVRKMQVRYVILGFIATSTITLIFNLFLQNTISQDLFRLGNLSPIILIACIYYAIARYHLMNIKSILRLGTVYTLLVTTITFIYVLGGYIFIRFLKVGEPWNFIIPSFFITFCFLPIKNLLELVTDKVFFRRQYKFSDVAAKIESSIHEAGLNLDKTLEIINQIVTDSLKVRKSAILILIPKGHFISRQVIGEKMENIKLKQDNPIIKYLNAYKDKILDKEELERDVYNRNKLYSPLNKVISELDKNELALAVPIELNGKLIGVYLLGAKKSQNTYTEEDIRLLRHVAWEMGFSIDNASSYEELKRLDDVKSNFISVVSHQLRTPVTVTRCNLELCFDKEVSRKEKDEAVKSAYEGAISLGRQLDQLITVLEIEEKKVALKKSKVKVSDLIKQVVSDNRINLDNKKIKLTIKNNKLDDEILCDEFKVKKVLDILLINAISYVFPEGKINVSLEKEIFNHKTKLIVSIADNGVGIIEESRTEVFKKFFRSPEAVAISPNGFGLGLFIAKKIVEAHGGDISFEPNDGRGVTFFFSLPLK